MDGNRKKFPKYIKIYNQILKSISEGIYPEGSKLPTENELGEELSASRVTIRQALKLLKEDGIIETIQGSGNYVRKTIGVKEEVGLEEKGQIVKKVCGSDIKEILYKMKLQPTAEYPQKIFQRKTPVVVTISRKYKDENAALVAYTFSMMLTDVLEECKIDLNDIETIKVFLENNIYKEGYKIQIEMKSVPKSKAVELGEIKSDSGQYLLLTEMVYDISGRLILHSKHYIPIENVNILMWWN